MGGGGRTARVKVAVADEDRSAFTGRLVAALKKEDKPTFYRYKQTFTLPAVMQGERRPFDFAQDRKERGEITRTTLIGLLKIEPYDKGIVLPHEQTFPKHKEDRLRLLEATHSHLECIFGLFEDAGFVGPINAFKRAKGLDRSRSLLLACS